MSFDIFHEYNGGISDKINSLFIAKRYENVHHAFFFLKKRKKMVIFKDIYLGYFLHFFGGCL